MGRNGKRIFMFIIFNKSFFFKKSECRSIAIDIYLFHKTKQVKMSRNRERRVCGVSDNALVWLCIFIVLYFCYAFARYIKVPVLISVNRHFYKMLYNLQTWNVCYGSQLTIFSRVTIISVIAIYQTTFTLKCIFCTFNSCLVS